MLNESESGGVKLNESGSGVGGTTAATISDTKASPQKPTDKDRTLFCIKIDSKCTEEILYELFLQAGPIDNLIRKTDRNGSLICLVTYKHVESCEYAIQLFNGLHLFGQAIRVQLSQVGGSQSGNVGSLNRSSSSYNSSPANSNTQSGGGYGMKRNVSSSTPTIDRTSAAMAATAPHLLPHAAMAHFDPNDPTVQQMMLPFVNQIGALLTNPMANPQIGGAGHQDQYGSRSRSSHSGGRGAGGGGSGPQTEHYSRRGEYHDNRASNNNQYQKNPQSHMTHSSWQPPVSRDSNFNNNNNANPRHSRHQTYGQPNRFNNNNNNNPMVQNNFNNFNNNSNNGQRSRSRSPSNKRHKRF